jgi:general stress protein YciG
MNKLSQAKPKTFPKTKTSAATGQAERDGFGRFVVGSPAARAAGMKGANLTSGKFVKGSERARTAGSKGGRASKSKSA